MEQTKEEQTKEEQPSKQSGVGDTKKEDSILNGLDATPEELAVAATRISAVYKGRKAREDVAAKKKALDASKAEASEVEKSKEEPTATPKPESEADKLAE